jgi:hypothetical protein
MYKPLQQNTKFRAEQKALRFNFNKLQAVLCLLASAAVSIGLIYLGIRPFI